MPNPYHGFIDLTVNGITKRYENSPEEHVIDLSFARIDDMIAEEVSINIYDDTGLELEAQILTGDKTMQLQYGYSEGVKSRIYSLRILKYSLNFIGDGRATINIEAISDGAVDANTSMSSEYAMRIHEVVLKICEEEGWTPGYIEECVPIYVDESDGEVKDNEVIWQRVNQTAIYFINNTLIPEAVSERTNKGDYICRVYDKSGVTVCDFHSKSTIVEKKYDFVVGVDEDIIEFQPEFQESLTAMLGADTIATEYQEPYTNQYAQTETQISSTAQGHSTESRTVTHNSPSRITTRNESELTMLRGVGIGSVHHTRMEAYSQALFDAAASNVYPATLQILGRPHISPATYITVIVLTRDGYKHHSSGAYYIDRVEDEISGGGYVTTLQLTRSGSGMEPLPGNQRPQLAMASPSGARYMNSSPGSQAAAGSIKGMMDWARSKTGGNYWYSQSKRMQEGWFDCSSLVLRAMRAAGLDSTGENLFTYTIANDKRFTEIPLSQAREGDIVWHSGHMALVNGDGRTVEAMTDGKPIQYGNMSSRWKKAYRIVV